MSPRDFSALEQALAGVRAPGLFARLRDRPLPGDVLLLLRIVAGEAQARELGCTVSGEPEATVVEAASLFIQQAMFYPGSDSHRVLGVTSLAADSQIKEHYRWLVRWLHPDRNADGWEAIYADRVNIAWQDLRTPERRAEYEAQLAVAPKPPGPELGPNALRVIAVRKDSGEFLFSSRALRRLPVLILGGLAVGSVAVLGLQYYLVREAPSGISEVMPPTTAEVGRISAAFAALPEETEVLVAAPIEASAPKVLPAQPDSRSPAPVPAEVKVLQSSLPVVIPAPSVIPGPTPANEAPLSVPARDPWPLPAAASTTAGPSTTSAAPVSAPAVVREVPSPESSLIDEAIARDVIMRFRSAYSSGNISQMSALLASGTGGHDGRSAILRNYRKLFETSVSRHIELSNPIWLTDGDTAILIARYRAWIIARGESEERSFMGEIRFDLRSEDGELRITRLRHGSVGG